MSCAYSVVMDHHQKVWQDRLSSVTPSPLPLITSEEIAEFRRLLGEARERDRIAGRTGCELDEKKATLRALAKQLGVDIELP